jgi:hypothetical protein
LAPCSPSYSATSSWPASRLIKRPAGHTLPEQDAVGSRQEAVGKRQEAGSRKQEARIFAYCLLLIAYCRSKFPATKVARRPCRERDPAVAPLRLREESLH